MKIEEYHLPSFSWGIFSQVMHLDQSCKHNCLMDHKVEHQCLFKEYLALVTIHSLATELL